MSASWIVGTDFLVDNFIKPEMIFKAQNIKGIFFVVSSSLILSFWVERKLSIMDEGRIFNKTIFFFSTTYSILWILITDTLATMISFGDYSLQTFKGLFYVFTWSLIMTWVYKKEKDIKKSLFPILRQSQLGLFWGMLVHEVRTPLQVALINNDFLQRDKEYSEKRVEGIRKSLEGIKVVINFFSSLSGKQKLDENLLVENIDFRELTDYTFEGMKLLFKDHKVSLDNKIAAPLIVKGSKSLLEHLLINLFKNGIEHMIKENVKTKELVITSEMNEMGVPVVSISNPGSAIPSKDHGKIFVPFITTKREHGGMGLGLLVAKEIIEAHKGKIWYEAKSSIPTFSFTLPPF